jgi:hypothetical protein
MPRERFGCSCKGGHALDRSLADALVYYVTRCVRRAFLLRDQEHNRKEWIESRARATRWLFCGCRQWLLGDQQSFALCDTWSIWPGVLFPSCSLFRLRFLTPLSASNLLERVAARMRLVHDSHRTESADISTRPLCRHGAAQVGHGIPLEHGVDEGVRRRLSCARALTGGAHGRR